MKFLYMVIKLRPEFFFVFDLDDTLYYEIDFLKSAYRSIAEELETVLGVALYKEMWTRYKRREDVFGWLAALCQQAAPHITKESLLQNYRTHLPQIQLPKSTERFLHCCKQAGLPMGLITDGRSISQRNKLKSLGIEELFAAIVISEEFGSSKPCLKNFIHFEERFPGREFFYFADNTSKDFIAPAKLGWKTICRKATRKSLYAQDFTSHPKPDYIINSFSEVRLGKNN